MRRALCLLGGILLLSGSSQACFIAGDLNGDCQVDFEDLVLAASQWMQASCDAETGLVAHWKLDESSGSTAADSSGSGYDGAVVGASWNPAGGALGGALQFDGDNDYVSITQGGYCRIQSADLCCMGQDRPASRRNYYMGQCKCRYQRLERVAG